MFYLLMESLSTFFFGSIGKFDNFLNNFWKCLEYYRIDFNLLFSTRKLRRNYGNYLAENKRKKWGSENKRTFFLKLHLLLNRY